MLRKIFFLLYIHQPPKEFTNDAAQKGRRKIVQNQIFKSGSERFSQMSVLI